MALNRREYGSYNRQEIRRKSSQKDEILKAFDIAWRDGKTFSITLTHDGNIRVVMERKEVGYYADGMDFVRDFMPELMEKTG